jgi:citrate synthase
MRTLLIAVVSLPNLGTALLGAAAANLVFGTVLYLVMRGKLDPPRVNDELKRALEDERQRADHDVHRAWEQTRVALEEARQLSNEYERLWNAERAVNDQLREVVEQERRRADAALDQVVKALARWERGKDAS